MKSPHSLIVGGTRGIGREVTSSFAAAGHKVSVLARRAPARAGKGSIRYWQADICDAPVVRETIRVLARERGKINNLIFVQRFRGDGDPWEGELDTSLTATRSVVETSLDHFATGDKSIVAISSINASLIVPYLPVGYHAAKAALCQMVRYWAVLLGPRGFRVNSVSPGTVLKEESRAFFLGNVELSELYRRITPLARFGGAAEVAGVVRFLCSPQASFVTGQDIVVDGGVSLQWQESLVRQMVEKPKRKTKTKASK